MVAGNWLNQDGLYLQFGTQKAVPEVGGDYLMYGDNREIETYICLANTQFGGGTGATSGGFVQVPALPSSFSGTSSAIAAGIQSLTTFVPLQQTAVVNSASGGNGLILLNPQIYIDTIEFVTLVTANAGTGGAASISVGLAYATEAGANSVFAQVAPNAGVQFVSGLSNAAMTTGSVITYRSENTAGTGGGGTVAYSTANTASITAGPVWIGNMPITTSFLNGSSGALANGAYISAIANSGTYSGTTAAGLVKMRIRYNIYGAINQ